MDKNPHSANGLIQQIKAAGGFLVLETGHNFNFALCLELEKLAKSGLVNLVQITEKSITYSLYEDNEQKKSNDAEYEKPHFFAITFDMHGRNWRGKIVNIDNENIDVLYRDINGALAHTRINSRAITS